MENGECVGGKAAHTRPYYTLLRCTEYGKVGDGDGFIDR